MMHALATRSSDFVGCRVAAVLLLLTTVVPKKSRRRRIRHKHHDVRSSASSLRKIGPTTMTFGGWLRSKTTHAAGLPADRQGVATCCCHAATICPSGHLFPLRSAVLLVLGELRSKAKVEGTKRVTELAQHNSQRRRSRRGADHARAQG